MTGISPTIARRLAVTLATTCLASCSGEAEAPVNPTDAETDGASSDVTLTDAMTEPGLPTAWNAIFGRVGRPPASNPFPGIDVCSVEFTCPNGARGFVTRVALDIGWDWSMDPRCLRRPDDPTAAIGPRDEQCSEPAGAPCPASWEFVSIGEEGRLYLLLDAVPGSVPIDPDAGLIGCTVTVQTLPWVDQGFDIMICRDADETSCRLIGRSESYSVGDDVSFVVPPVSAD